MANRLSKEEAVARWRELKQRLRAGEIKFEEYAKRKRRLKQAILQG